MATYKLYGRGESGNTYKVALMLNLCELDWAPEFVDFFDPETKSRFRSAVNQMGEIPVLEFGSERLTQSGVILTYLSALTGRFGGKNEEERLEILRWLLFDNHRFSSFYATLRMRVGLKGEVESPVTEFLRMQANAAFVDVERHLDGRSYVVGDRPTIADISMAGYIYFDEKTGIDLATYPRISAWASRISRLPGWAHPYDLMPRAMGLERQ
ncbi:glutathione S-transferase family protein [Marinobacter nanhaiticus D15-8W]|uniref:Glutathione S-transferase family protein n=1 Tax=Marinobacter nanhaiticus D15-8W TaxID=626887 RepID=N6WTU5_9GAMM|nr:glutathione S-transferase family protein [Marinobacter nanhaiticus]ENO14941.1 glutathione S-transferase family protein [Marinobacter nanhaiticus D15-8W]BES69363.1 glutathione S-transferase family protein [Marinobacter nanhaiticus D15-8W]